MPNHRPGAHHAGPGRVLASRVLLLLIISFLVAGSGIAALMSLGAHPIR